ncbi:hypothetical protein J1614_010438 [Plenodomus biglobosus]|nr:hypothetical protein J1614_010438 [Plenodomus biglobosus]
MTKAIPKMQTKFQRFRDRPVKTLPDSRFSSNDPIMTVHMTYRSCDVAERASEGVQTTLGLEENANEEDD